MRKINIVPSDTNKYVARVVCDNYELNDVGSWTSRSTGYYWNLAIAKIIAAGLHASNNYPPKYHINDICKRSVGMIDYFNIVCKDYHWNGMAWSKDTLCHYTKTDADAIISDLKAKHILPC